MSSRITSNATAIPLRVKIPVEKLEKISTDNITTQAKNALNTQRQIYPPSHCAALQRIMDEHPSLILEDVSHEAVTKYLITVCRRELEDRLSTRAFQIHKELAYFKKKNKAAITTYLRERASDALKVNNAEINELKEHLKLPTDIVAIKAHHNFFLLKKCQIKIQTTLRQAENTRRELIDINGVNTARLTQLEVKMIQNRKDIAGEINQLEKLENELSHCGQIRDLFLRLKRVFGGGGAKTRGEYCEAIQLHRNSLVQLEALNRTLPPLIGQLNMQILQYDLELRGVDTHICDLEKSLESIEQELPRAKEEIVGLPVASSIRAIRSKVSRNRRDYGVLSAEGFELRQRINDLERINKQLKIIMSGDLLSQASFSFIRDTLSGAERKMAVQRYDDWITALNENTPIQRTLQNELRDTQALALLGDSAIEKWGNSLSGHDKLDRADILFSMLCIDKISAYPLTDVNENTWIVTPDTLV